MQCYFYKLNVTIQFQTKEIEFLFLHEDLYTDEFIPADEFMRLIDTEGYKNLNYAFVVGRQ